MKEAGKALQKGEILRSAQDDEGKAQDDERVEKVQDAPAEDEQPWTMGVWSGLPQWRCRLCAWDTLAGEEAMLKHIAVQHSEPRKPRGFLVADSRGRVVS